MKRRCSFAAEWVAVVLALVGCSPSDSPSRGPSRGDAGMGAPASGETADQAAQRLRDLYLTPGGIYTAADIEANGRMSASQKYADYKPAPLGRAQKGEPICPVARTKADPACTWTVGGKTYAFCCPPCIDQFVLWAKESPQQVGPPESYVQ